MTRCLPVVVLLLAMCARTATAEPRKLVVVVAKGSPIVNVSRQDLKRSFLGEPVDVGSVRLAPFNAEPRTPSRVAFDENVLGMSADEVGRYWVDRKVRGESSPPRSLAAPYIAKVVAKFPGAISYLPVDQLTPDIKPVTVDGLGYQDPHYSISSP